MGKFVESLKGKVAAYKGWLAVKLGNGRVAELEAKYAEAVGLVTLAGQLMDVAKRNQDGAMTAFGLLQQKTDEGDRNAAVTIAALLTVNGGEVSITADTIKAVETADIVIDYQRAEDGTVTLKLVPPEEFVADEGEFDDEEDTAVDEEHCDGGCDCGAKPEAPAQAA